MQAVMALLVPVEQVIQAPRFQRGNVLRLASVQATDCCMDQLRDLVVAQGREACCWLSGRLTTRLRVKEHADVLPRLLQLFCDHLRSLDQIPHLGLAGRLGVQEDVTLDRSIS